MKKAPSLDHLLQMKEKRSPEQILHTAAGNSAYVVKLQGEVLRPASQSQLSLIDNVSIHFN